MARNGGRIMAREWIKYAALFMLAVAALGVAALALMGPPKEDEALPAPVRPLAATPTAFPAPTPTPAAAATAAAATTGPPVRIELPARPVLLILGDSYASGDGAARPDQGWAYLVAGELGYPATIDGMGGTGFAWGGGAQEELSSEYETRLRKIAANPAFVPNVLVLQGGQNDAQVSDPHEVRVATTQTIEAARRFWPGVQVVVMGPSAPQPRGEELRGVNMAVRAGAAAANAPYIDPIDAGWFTTANSPGFDFDGAHPNSAGHAYIARKFLESWAVLTR